MKDFYPAQILEGSIQYIFIIIVVVTSDAVSKETHQCLSLTK